MVSFPMPLKSWFRGLSVTPKRSFDQWVSEELIIPEGSHEGQFYNLDVRPFARLLIEAVSNYRQCWITASPRTGKSIFAIGVGLWRACEYGDSVQFVAPDAKLIEEFFQEKIEPIFLANPRLEALLPVGYTSTKTPDHFIRLRNGGILRLVFNPNDIRSYDASCTIGTEASKFTISKTEADVVSLALARMGDHPHDSIAVFESQPERDDTRIAVETAAGTNSFLTCPCPHCKKHFEAGARDFISGWDVETEDKIDTHIICPNCQKRIDEKHRPAMWKGVQVVHRTPTSKRFSVTINWFHGATPFEEVGLNEWRNKNAPSLTTLRELMQKNYAIPLTDEMEEPEVDYTRVTKATFIERRLAYKSGTAPKGLILTAGVDVQEEWMYYTVLGFDPQGTVYWVDWDTVKIVPVEHQKRSRNPIAATPEMVLNGLEECYARLMKFNPATIWIDSSYKHTASDVPLIKQWAAKYTNVQIIAGRANTEMARMDNATNELPAQVRDYMQARPQNNGQLLWFLNVDRLKTNLYNRMLMPPRTAGGAVFPSDVMDDGRSYLTTHILNEKRDIMKTRNGTDIIRWVKKFSKSRNDTFDTSVYAFAAGLFVLAARGFSPVQPAPKDKRKRKELPEAAPLNPLAPPIPQFHQPQPQRPQMRPTGQRPLSRPQTNRRSYGF